MATLPRRNNPMAKRVVAMAAVILLCDSVWAQSFANRSSVQDGAGIRSAAGAYTQVSAAGQPGGIACSGAAGYVNRAGFLNSFCLDGTLDTDRDGLPNELDADNDGDSLDDRTELDGSAFDPATATDPNLCDSDEDGMTDSDESVAGTDPLDDLASLRMAITRDAGISVSWTARSNKTYRLCYAATPTEPITNTLGVVTACGMAAPPWFTMTSTVTDGSPGTARVYRVEVLP